MDKKGLAVIVTMAVCVLFASLCALACCIVAIFIFAGVISADFSVAVILLLSMVILGLITFILISHISTQSKKNKAAAEIKICSNLHTNKNTVNFNLYGKQGEKN